MSYDRNTRPMAWPKLLVTDILLLGISLLVFAYFHHVRPQKGGPGQVITPMVSASPTPSGNTVSPGQTSAPSSDTSGETDYSYLGLGAKFYDKFNLDGSVTVTENSYVGGRVAIYLSEIVYENSVCHVADIYLCDVSNFRTVLAEDTFGRNITEAVESMSRRVGGILAINGDYYGSHAKSFIVRNGVLYDDSKADDDICVLYSDGTMVSYYEDDFDVNAAIAGGAWQAWSFGPKLLDNGQRPSSYNSKVSPRNPRAALGYFEPGHYCIVAVDGRTDESAGLTLPQLSALFMTLGCTDAYNLDGGNTTAMYLNGTLTNVRSGSGTRPCSDAVVIVDN